MRINKAKPFQFWINNDDDNGSGSGGSDVVPPTTPDYESPYIVSTRDLEDWTRLWIYTKGLNTAINAGTIKVGLKWKQVTRGTPGIKIVQATDSDGGTEYLTDSTFAAATAQITSGGSPRPVLQDANDSHTNIMPSSNTADFVFPTSLWTSLTDAAPKTFFLFEGTSEGEGQLEIVFLKSDGVTKIGEGGNLWLDLRDIKEMYERETSMPVPNKPYNYSLSPPTVSIGPVPDRSNPNGNSGTFVPDPTESSTHTYIVFVHGYNMTIAGSTNYAETMFKRLWHRGYKGRFCYFRWNTGYSTWFGNYVPIDGQDIDSYLANYNGSEYTAWHSGAALDAFIGTAVPSSYSKNLVAHSMGNIVAGSGFLNGLTVSHYAMLQAAVPSCCYDTSTARQQTTSTVVSYEVGGININVTLWANPTPDNDPDSITQALAYRGRLASYGSNNLYSFYQPDDLATQYYWEGNNAQFKPSSSFFWHYFYSRTSPSGQKLWYDSPLSLIRYLTDPLEAMPYADQSWSKAAGADAGTGGAITGGVNNETAYNFGGDHSAEFVFDIQEDETTFYHDLLSSLQIPQNP